MRPSCLAVSLLVLFILLSSVEGIRLEKSFKSTGRPKLHVEGALMKNSNGVMGGVILCNERHCSGNGRKLLTATTASSLTSTTSSKNEENRENKTNPTSEVKSVIDENGGKQEKFPVGLSPAASERQEFHDDQYADIMDIAEMDYSPAKKKPPIHN